MLFVFSLLIWTGLRLGAEPIPLNFQESHYTVVPGETLTISITLGEPVPDGLGAYLLRLNFAENLFELTDEDIIIVEELDFGLFEPGAERSIGPGFAEVRGFAELGSPYFGTAFVDISVTIGVNAPSGMQTLFLEIPETNGFVDGEGQVIDDQVVLGTATVEVVVPPPEVASAPVLDSESGRVTLSFNGLAGRSYRLEESDDLVAWLLLSEVTAGPEGEIVYEDMDASDALRRFYRLVDH